jgi:hypothetical protein
MRSGTGQGREMEHARQKRKGGRARARTRKRMRMTIDVRSIHPKVRSKFMDISYFAVLINHPESIVRIIVGNVTYQQFHSQHHAI